LSYRESDENGVAEPRSPFLDEVRRLLEPAPPETGEVDSAEEALTIARDLTQVGPSPRRAPSEAELDQARRAEAASREPGPLSNPAVLAALAAVPSYGGTTLEGFDVCSYRWFVSHELDPQQLDPAPDPLVQGGLMHAVLDRLYRERPGDD